jgi:hypothetical protein
MAISALHAAAFIARREQLLVAAEPGYDRAVHAQPDKLGAIHAASAVFAELSVPYALIGGLAVGIRSGVPRATLDVDFAIQSQAAAGELIRRMVEHGFRLVGEFEHSLNFEHSSGEPVQLAFDASFDESIARAELMTFGDMQVRVVKKDDLLAMKRKAAADPGRRRSKALRDQADIALLEGDVPDTHEGW